jgi:hypothetical protein
MSDDLLTWAARHQARINFLLDLEKDVRDCLYREFWAETELQPNASEVSACQDRAIEARRRLRVSREVLLGGCRCAHGK